MFAVSPYQIKEGKTTLESCLDLTDDGTCLPFSVSSFDTGLLSDHTLASIRNVPSHQSSYVPVRGFSTPHNA